MLPFGSRDQPLMDTGLNLRDKNRRGYRGDLRSMSKGNRLRNYLLGFLAGLTLASLVGYSFWSSAVKLDDQIALQAQKEAAQYTDPAYIDVECDAAAVPASGQSNCIAAEQEAANDAQRNSYDLEAQQTVAVWTRVMGKAAIVGMGVGILGLFLIFVTFWETRKAADAGRESNTISKGLQRARIVPFAIWELDRKHQSRIVFSCENVGLSPAINLRCALTVELEAPKHPPQFQEWGERRIVKAGGDAELTLMDERVLDRILVGCISYDTLFEKDRRALVCIKFEQSPRNGSWYSIDCRPDTWPNDT